MSELYGASGLFLSKKTYWAIFVKYLGLRIVLVAKSKSLSVGNVCSEVILTEKSAHMRHNVKFPYFGNFHVGGVWSLGFVSFEKGLLGNFCEIFGA